MIHRLWNYFHKIKLRQLGVQVQSIKKVFIIGFLKYIATYVTEIPGLTRLPMARIRITRFLDLVQKICITLFYSIIYQHYAIFFDNFFHIILLLSYTFEPIMLHKVLDYRDKGVQKFQNPNN